MKKGISPIDCNHLGSIFIRGGWETGIDLSGHHGVKICPRCGTFHVFKVSNGRFISVDFTLVSEDQIYAAGQYARYLAEPEDTIENGEV